MESLMLINVRSMGVRCSGFGINAYKTLVVPLSYYGLNPNQNATSNENTQLCTNFHEDNDNRNHKFLSGLVSNILIFMHSIFQTQAGMRWILPP